MLSEFLTDTKEIQTREIILCTFIVTEVTVKCQIPNGIISNTNAGYLILLYILIIFVTDHLELAGNQCSPTGTARQHGCLCSASAAVGRHLGLGLATQSSPREALG